MRRPVRTTVFLLVAATALAGSSAAQGAAPSSDSPLPATDSIFKRARRLVSEGDGAAGRAIVDSMLRVATEGTLAYGNALFWRGALAETAADAERDYRRVIVEYPVSPYADDALLSLAELEQARGDRTSAFQHLQRFVREHPLGPARARAGLAAARLAFEQRDLTRGCAMIADARLSAGSDVELRNQIDYHGSRCPATAAAVPAPAPATPSTGASSVRTSGATTTAAPTPGPATPPGARSTTTTTTTSAPPPSASPTPMAPRPDTGAPRTTSVAARPEPPAPAAAPRGIWTIQLAAYNTRPDAEALVRRLATRGVKARISGDARPFRVRLDYYQTRQEAAAQVAALKERGIVGFVTDEPRPTGAMRP
ncbi:MAG TPA: SPOR domain-containing protein [Gemmatimonadaceae bacterium]|nr:SPOR domain-containing protein [Gemmatimonadaceae bacterium]